MGLHEMILIDAIPTPGTPNVLRSKHVVQAIYEAGIKLAEKPISRNGLVPRLFATLELDQRPIAFMKWQHRPIRGATNTSGGSGDDTVDVARPGEAKISSLQISRRYDESGLIPFPGLPGVDIRWETFGEAIDIRQSFSCFLEALAECATHSPYEMDAYVNAVSLSGSVSLNMHGTGFDKNDYPLPWGQMMQTLTAVWSRVALIHRKSIDFFLEDDEQRMAAGFLQSFESRGSGIRVS